LHHQDAERRAATQHRHAEEGLIDFFARLRLVGKGRVGLSVRERKRLGCRGDEADETFLGAHRGHMHRFALQSFGGEQLQWAIGPRDIKRADFRHHIGGDKDNDPIEPRLSRNRLRHHLAKPPQQKTRSARGAHDSSSLCSARSP
jgi:hypothetical protein